MLRFCFTLFSLLLLNVAAFAQPLPPGITPELVDRARELLRSVPFTDGHNDLPSSLLDVVRGDLDAPGADLRRVQPELPADIPRLREGGVGAQFWSAYVDVDYIPRRESLRQVVREIDVIHRFVARYEEFEFARTADDIERVHRRRPDRLADRGGGRPRHRGFHRGAADALRPGRALHDPDPLPHP